MNFHKFASYLQRLEDTTKRLEMIDILTELVNEVETSEISQVMYLTSGGVDAAFSNIKFNMADKMAIRSITEAYSTPNNILAIEDITKIYKRLGDLGDVAYELNPQKEETALTTAAVHEKLLGIAQAEGAGSQENKVKNSADLLRQVDKTSAKYIVRIILGTTRLGFTETTIIEALANSLGDRKLKKAIEATYNIHPDIGLIAKTIKETGVEGLDKIKIQPGIPVLSQKAQRASGFMDEAIERIGKVWAENKFDGTRVQLHLDKGVKNVETESSGLFGSTAPGYMVKTFTRNLEETTHQYPDLVEGAVTQVSADSIILDGEAIGYNKETGEFLPFQETIQRKRKHGVKEAVENIPLKYFIFDILYVNGKSVIDNPLYERRKLIETYITQGEVLKVDSYLETENVEELEAFYQRAKDQNLEGLIAKNPNDPYQAGARSYSWIKLKTADEKLLDDSVDTVLLGYYVGKGVRTQFGIGGLLVGTYDQESDTYKTLTKIGTGLKEDDWHKLKAMADKVAINKPATNVEMDKMYTPDVLVKPSIVLEIGADEISLSQTHTAGYALRFPRLLRFREDKAPTECTTLSEIEQMFDAQRGANK